MGSGADEKITQSMEDKFATTIAITLSHLNEDIMEAAKNGLVVQAEVVLNEVTFDGGVTVDTVPEIRVSVFQDLTVDVK